MTLFLLSTALLTWFGHLCRTGLRLRREGSGLTLSCGSEPVGTFLRRTRYLVMTEDFSVRPSKPLTPEQRKERDALRARRRRARPCASMTAAQKKFYANKERLKAQRLAREQSKKQPGNDEGGGRVALMDYMDSPHPDAPTYTA